MNKKNIAILDKTKMNEIADQLCCPSGKEGVAMGERLNESNIGMITESIISLSISNKNRVLELGHGNCSYLPNLMSQALGIRYFGLEVSKTMKNEAERINVKYLRKKHALFQLYDGKKIPYVLNFFDRILTVNTIYFWENPIIFLNEIYRVLKPNGVFVLTFAKSSFMKNLPFVSNTSVFSLYDNYKLEKLISKTNFSLVDIKNKTERVKSKTGKWVNREYSIAVLRKKEIKTNLG